MKFLLANFSRLSIEFSFVLLNFGILSTVKCQTKVFVLYVKLYVKQSDNN